MFGNLLCSIGIHKWNNKESGFYQPIDLVRICMRCNDRQVWIPIPLALAMQTDVPEGVWVREQKNDGLCNNL